jgi:uncharacterized membrane protein YdjX (TVP38/TMEM64 family)
MNSTTGPRWKLLLGLCLGVGVVLVLWRFPVARRISELLGWMRGQGLAGAAVFVVVYVLACVLFLPGSLLTLGAGAVFGVGVGFPLVSLSSTLGATASFLVGRFLLRDWVARRASSHPRFAAVERAVARGGWRIVGLLRLSPLFPFNLLNYGLGLTPVRLREYVLASWIGMMPGTLLYVWLGALAGDVTQLASGSRPRSPWEWAFYGLGLLATLGVTVYITRLARTALQKSLAIPPAPDVTVPDSPNP